MRIFIMQLHVHNEVVGGVQGGVRVHNACQWSRAAPNECHMIHVSNQILEKYCKTSLAPIEF